MIATSLKRTDMLINKALYSIYNQKNIDSKKIKIMIIDDNKDINEIENIKIQVKKLRKKLNWNDENIVNTTIIKNQKTKYHSGTGSWNTAIEIINNKIIDSFIAILDDDDHYADDYIKKLFEILDKKPKTIAIFSPLIWCSNNEKEILVLKKDDLTKEKFFIGNPGVQGSNMFFRAKILKEIDGFDEKLVSATDRDLMIRFIHYAIQNSLFYNIEILDKSYVFYNADNSNSISKNLEKKHLGLDVFYKKHKNNFSEEAYFKSLERAKGLFDYNKIHS
jgi:hypothetical protein